MDEWERYKDAFAWDGSLRDLYVHGTNEHDWQAMLTFLRSSAYALHFSVDGEPRPLPGRVADIFALGADAHTALRVDGDHLALMCHFFTPDEIEFDLHPRAIDSQAQYSRLLGFIRALGHAVGKAVVLTPENCPDYPYVRYDPLTDRLEWWVDQSGDEERTQLFDDLARAAASMRVAEADRAVVRLGEAAVDHLFRALIDADSQLRAYAAYALRHVAQRDPRVREALTAALQDEDAQVRRYAAESLQAGGHG